MKQGSFKIFCLIIWACVTVFSGYGDDVTISYETKVLETFNGGSDSEYIWKTEASKFATPNFPVLASVEAWPVAAFGYVRADNDPPLRSLGLNGRFDRQGFNWIDLYPVLADDPDETPYEIPIPGRVRYIDLWVWGSNLQFYIEFYVRDFQGIVHVLRLGDIDYTGWRNLRVNVPNNIPQARRIVPTYTGLQFVKMRIWTQPVERVGNFYIYFKQLKVLTDMFESLWDGNDLANPQRVQQLWSNSN
jgi:hypothetical protein